MTRIRGRLGAVLLALSAISGHPVTAQPAPPPPIEHFVKAGQWHSAQISPSGERLAVVLTSAGGRLVLGTMPLTGPAPLTVIATYRNADIDGVAWVNEERLIYVASQSLFDEGGWGTFAVNHDGSEPVQLIGAGGGLLKGHGGPWRWALHRTRDDNSNNVVVRSYEFTASGLVQFGSLALLDTKSGRVSIIGKDVPPFARQWLFDAQGELRIVTTLDKGRRDLHWRKPGSVTWQRVLSQNELDPEVLVAKHLEGEHTLIVEGRRPGRDSEALYTMDLRTGSVDAEPIAALDGFDIDARIDWDTRTHRVVGVHTHASHSISLWFTDRMAAVQRAVDGALPGRRNLVHCGRCDSSRHFIVFSRSDTHPGEYLHYDEEKKSIRRLQALRPELDESTQGRRSYHRVPSRDGLLLPVYVTHPGGSAPGDRGAPSPLPTVLHVHGGPWLRGHRLEWNDYAQFLASRGYRVLEVEFRGSTGYGWRHFRAGWKNWGTSMQDDLADAVAWGVSAGWVDPTRVCVFGMSYGGYAALMAPIRHPGLFRCAASFAGVTDPSLLYTATWGDFTDDVKRFTLPVLVGDPKADAALLDAASPLKRVAELKVPVLLAYGMEDSRVPKEHADRFASAARAAGVQMERVPYPDEGHGFVKLENHADFLRKLEAFLARSLK
jgi:dipeptidyl aminopeptidase/acylaminoacyl peptidase